MSRLLSRQMPVRLGADGSRLSSGTPQLLLYWMIGALLLIGPASMAPGLGWDLKIVKLVRIGLLGLIVLVSLRWFRLAGNHTASHRMLLLAAFFTVSALWGPDIVMGLAYKGLFFGSCVVGIALGYAISSRRATLSFLRVMLAVSVLALGVILAARLTGEAVMWNGRLVVYGLNPNFLGQSVALVAILALLHGLLDRSALRVLSWGVGLVGIWLVVLTGSRGAAALVLISLLGLGLFRYLGRSRETITVVVWGTVLVVIGSVVSLMGTKSEPALQPTPSSLSITESFSEVTVDDGEEIRMISELTKDTRSGVWRAGGRHFMARPLVGWGWKSNPGGGWATYQSAYIQVLVESGLVGGILLVYFLLAAIRLMIRGLASGVTRDRFSYLRAIYAAVVGALLLHGAFESALVVGTTPNAVILGFALVNLENLVGRRPGRRGLRRRTFLVPPAPEGADEMVGGPLRG